MTEAAKRLQRDQLALKFIRGHAGHTGNELADRGAGIISENPSNFSDFVSFPSPQQIRRELWSKSWTKETNPHNAAENRTNSTMRRAGVSPKILVNGDHVSRSVQGLISRACLENLFWRGNTCVFCNEDEATTSHVVEKFPALEFMGRHFNVGGVEDLTAANPGERADVVEFLSEIEWRWWGVDCLKKEMEGRGSII